MSYGSTRNRSVVRWTGAKGVLAPSEETSEPYVQPDTWRDLTQFREWFSGECVFGLLTLPDDGNKTFLVVRDIEKVRSAAVPIDQSLTFNLSVLGPEGKIVDEICLTIEEIGHVRTIDLSFAFQGRPLAIRNPEGQLPALEFSVPASRSQICPLS